MIVAAACAACLTLSGEADLRPTRRAVQQIAASLPFDGKQVADITLAVAEACVNGVRHGAAPGDDPLVTVLAHPADDHLSIEVVDRGIGFHIRPMEMPDAFSESGRGIALMHALMDQVAITSSRGGTRVRMIKYFNR
ncbi:MAG TPA: ATP-binding protein [Armatimonadota bacterium]|jgi:serine/threonine-protein kinase RsbW